MPRKKKIDGPGKSTVAGMRDECEWGRMLYDACYVFNLGLAEYWIEYASQYEQGDDDYANALEKAEALDRRREEVMRERSDIQKKIKDYSRLIRETCAEYASKAVIGEAVSKWRNLYGLERCEEYDDMTARRSELRRQCKALLKMQSDVVARLKSHIEANRFATRDLANKSNALRKHMAAHGKRLDHPICDDLIPIYDFILSDETTEHLMGLCISIVNKYSGKEFCTTMDMAGRERTAERIYEFFRNFQHNYDFITGCYEEGEDGLLKLKPLDGLAAKFYNGYYLTVRGYVQRAYAAARDEALAVSSIEEKTERNGNHGVNEDEDSDFSVVDGEDATGPYARPSGEFDDGMVEFWRDCKAYLESNAGEMADAIRKRMSRHFPDLGFYKAGSGKALARMSDMVMKTIGGIDEELTERRRVGSNLKHIVLDALGGAESQREWAYCTKVVSSVILGKMTEFFAKDSGKDEMK